MPPSAPSELFKVSSSPARFKAHFRPKLREWGLDDVRLRLLDSVFVNWLAGDAGEDIPHFRQHHYRQLRRLDDLVNRSLVTHGSGGHRYQPTFLAFCLLLASGSRTAIKLRSVMDQVHSLVKQYLKERPLRLQRPTSLVTQAIPANLRALLVPAVHLMADGSAGVNLNNAQAPDPDISFSDQVYRFDNPTQVAWHFLSDYRGPGTHAFVGVESVSVPFDLTRLQIASEAHTSASKALANLNTHPDSAVSHARAALEATFKHVLGAEHPALRKPFPQQAAAFRERLQLDEEFSALGTRIVATMVAIGDIRNTFGDSHGRTDADRGATRPEARLTVGTALLLCEFLLDRWEAVRSIAAPAERSTDQEKQCAEKEADAL